MVVLDGKNELRGAAFVQRMLTDADRCIHKTLTQNLNGKRRVWVNTCDPDDLLECRRQARCLKRDLEKALAFLERECARLEGLD